MSEKFAFETPVGRLVSGSFFEHQTKDHLGKDKPQEKWNFYAGLAFPKTTANWWDEPDNGPGSLGHVFTALRSAASAGFRNGEPQQPTFAWKIDNGDDPKHAEKDGYKGHWVLKFNRSFSIGPAAVFDNGSPAQRIDGGMAKRGHYYRISGSSSGNGATGNQAGVYVNMDVVQWVGHGKEIVGGASPEQAFTAPVQLPPGASATPIAGSPMPSAAQSPAASPAAPAQSPAAPAQSPAAPAQSPAAPAQSPAASPAAPAAPGATPAPQFADGGGYAAAPAVEEKYQYGGGAYTKAALLAAGHTEAMIATYPKA